MEPGRYRIRLLSRGLFGARKPVSGWIPIDVRKDARRGQTEEVKSQVKLVRDEQAARADQAQQSLSVPVLAPPAVVARAESLLEREPVHVRFRVALVDTSTVTTAAGATFTQFRLHPDSGWDISSRKGFYVTLSPEVERTLRRIGIADVPAHFKGKVIEVQGRLHSTVLQVYAGKPAWFYHIQIGDLNQLHSANAGAD
jgi:hypothetical protein